ncbi:hypothetical protein [Candidatus Liberibacter sp.]|uniref:hypothetical protein n=1 Tax=Candidatus Liberibacter sp. TaxID=34022 RepID=UPI0015F56487|nr:hypothetical protein [Candidatus Liberibacter sp.]MBA5724130.1 hypothetical protein [Candidatus Liberibacter sp.]
MFHLPILMSYLAAQSEFTANIDLNGGDVQFFKLETKHLFKNKTKKHFCNGAEESFSIMIS